MDQEVIESAPSDGGRRRRWTIEEKRSLIEMADQAGSSVAQVAKTFGISSSQLYLWRRQLADGELDADPPSFALVEVEAVEPRSDVQIEVQFMSGAKMLLSGDADKLLSQLVPLIR